MKFYEFEEGKIYKCNMFEDNLYKREEDELLEYRTADKKWHTVEVSVFHIYRYEFEEVKEMKTGWEKVNSEDGYYYILTDNTIGYTGEYNTDKDKENFNNHNYFSTKEKAEQIRYMNLLQRMMQKFADENNKGEIDWENLDTSKWKVVKQHRNNEYIPVYCWEAEDMNGVHFTSKIIAKRCIKEVIEPFMEGR